MIFFADFYAHSTLACLPALIAQLDEHLIGDLEVVGSTPSGWQHPFLEIDLEIFSTVNLSRLPIEGGYLSVSGKRTCAV